MNYRPDPSINQPFVSALESHEPKAKEALSKLPAYNYGVKPPPDVMEVRERLKEPIKDKDGNIYDGEV